MTKPIQRRELIDLVLTQTDAFEDYPFNGGNSHEQILWTIIKQKTNHKILAMIFEREGQLLIDLKLKPEQGAIMRQLRGVYPGYHMNKTHWNTIAVNDTEVSHEELVNMIKKSARLTLSRKK